MSASVSKFIGIIAVHFPKPRFEDTDTDEVIWQASLTRLLGHFAPEVLARAADTIIRTRTKKDGAFFPVPAECIEACEKAERIIAAEERNKSLLTVDKAPKEFSPERHKLAMDFFGTALGLEAVREGWYGALYDFAYRHARMPYPAEIDSVKAASKAFFADVERCERGEIDAPGLDVRKLGQLGRGIEARRRERVAKVVGGGS